MSIERNSGLPGYVDTFLFDLDGTLVDSAERIRKTLRATLSHCLGVDPTPEEIIAHTGVPLWDIMRQYDPDRISELVEYYREYYAAIGPTHAFEGIVEILHLLRSRNCPLAVVTTKGRESAEDHLKEAGLEEYFPVVVTFNEVSQPKPAKEPVELAIEMLGSAPDRSIMIGDSAADIQAGSGAGTLTGWARWGTDQEPDFDGIEPDYVWEHPGALRRDIPDT